MDAITLLRNDHKTVEQLFKQFEKAGDNAHVEKRRIVDRIIEELSVHAVIEEQVFYPVAREVVPDTEAITLESLEEHHLVKWVLSELDGMDPRHERFDAKVTVLMENVRHHVQEEQDELFPKVRDGLSRAALDDLGKALAKAKTSAPTHPHPRASDVPPANAVVGAVAGVVDRVGDNINGMAQGGVTAVQDLIARITGNDRPKTSPTGSSVARARATDVRRTANAVAGGVSDTTRAAKKGVTSTGRAASSAAKGTATTAKKAARATATTAKRGSTTTARTAKAAAVDTGNTAKRATKKVTAATR